MRRLTVMAALSMIALGASTAGAQDWVGGAPMHGQIRVGADGNTYVGVWIEAPQIATPAARAPMAVSLVIDTSGSMAGEKIANARMAASSLVESLADGDVVSIYAFSNQVLQIAPPTVVSAGSRGTLMRGIDQIYAGGGTNMWDGMQVGVQRTREAPGTHPLRRVFLISDGLANIGPSDPESFGNLAAQATEWGTQITAIGVGVDYDQRTLHAVAVRSSGRLYHLAQPQQMAQILESELSLMSRSVALSAVLEVVPAAGVTIISGETTGTIVEGGRLRLPLGALYAGQRREVLFRARVDTSRVGNRPLAEARLVYETPDDQARRVQRASIDLEVAREVRRPEVAPRVAAMVANHEATVAQARAAEALRQGQQAQAVAELERARRRLAETAAAAPASPYSGELRARASRMQSAGEAAGAAATPAAQRSMSYDFADQAAEAEGY